MPSSITRRPSSRDIAPSALPHLNTRMSGLIAVGRSTVGRWLARSRQRRALAGVISELHRMKHRWRANTAAFIEEVLFDPETNRPTS